MCNKNYNDVVEYSHCGIHINVEVTLQGSKVCSSYKITTKSLGTEITLMHVHNRGYA